MSAPDLDTAERVGLDGTTRTEGPNSWEDVARAAIALLDARPTFDGPSVPFDPERQTKASLVTARELYGMDRDPLGISCSACDAYLKTEGDFARHFTVPDSRYKNLGDCPVNPRTAGRW